MKNKYHVLFVMFVLLSGLNLAAAQNVTLDWNASLTPDTAGYNIYYGTVSGSCANKLPVANVTTATISNLTAGVTYYFTATTVDTKGNESGFSNEATYVVPGCLTLSNGANPGGPMLIRFPVASGQWYEIQATTNCLSWTTIWQTGVSTSNSWVQCTDPNASMFSSRFYRLVLH